MEAVKIAVDGFLSFEDEESFLKMLVQGMGIPGKETYFPTLVSVLPRSLIQLQ